MTPKQRRFVEEYCIDLNATQAAIRAGYSRHTANEIGAQNLAKLSIATAIAERQNAVTAQVQLTQEMVVGGLLTEARRTDEGSSHSARVSAWSWLGKYKRMFADADDGDRAPAPINVNVTIVNAQSQSVA